jgi:hypothetical protein
VRRYVRPGLDADVWCASGRWGPRRVLVSECRAVVRAEDIYTDLLRKGAARMKPGASGSVSWSLPGRPGPFSAEWEIRANAVWRFGRVFLRCPRCQRLATRIYVPRADAWAACRRCWGFSYESRQQRTYRVGGGLSRILGPLAHSLTRRERERRAEASERRYAERREILRARAGSDRQ